MALEDKVDRLSSALSRLESRLGTLEEQDPVERNLGVNNGLESGSEPQNISSASHVASQFHNYARPGTETTARPGQEQGPGPIRTLDTDTTGVSYSDSIQEEFLTIKDSLQRVRLPADQKLNDSRTGINRSEQPLYNVVAKCGRYVETALKWVGTQEPGEVSEESLIALHTILLANLRYLQSEYQAILVQSQFDKDTSRFFRSLQRDNNNFSNTALQNLRAAVEVTGLRGRQPNVDRPWRGGYSNRGRGYRGGGPRNYSNYGYRDSFQQFAQRGVSRFPHQGSHDDNN